MYLAAGEGDGGGPGGHGLRSGGAGLALGEDEGGVVAAKSERVAEDMTELDA